VATHKIKRGPGIDREKALELAKMQDWWRDDLIFYPNAHRLYYLWMEPTKR